jgi:threonine aldolase
VLELQESAAEMFGREAALFVPTGTMGNQIAIRLHTRPGEEVITEARSHVYNWEMATMASFSGCLARPVHAEQGRLTWSSIERALSPPVYYRAQTGLITLENTHNMAGGTVLSLDRVREITAGAGRKGLPVHLDGARIFNASTALGLSPAELARGCDSIMFCLSKGLAAPVGSLLLGDRDFIEEAWRIRKMLGGGMRQAGILAAAGLVALDTMIERLSEDHENARILAEALAEIGLFQIDLESVQTNIVLVAMRRGSSAEMVSEMRSRGILAVPFGPREIRFVTHKDVSRQGIQTAIALLQDLSRDKRFN